MPPTDDDLCESLIQFPPARCSRPRGHGGEHMTAEIPAQLSAVAAKMVTESDRLERDRRQLATDRADLAARIQRLRIAFWAFVAMSCAVAVAGIVVVVTATATAFGVAP